MFLPMRFAPDDRIVQRVLLGHRDDFAVLVSRYYAAVKAVIRSKLSNSADTDDVAQEVFIRAYERLDTLRTPQRFGAWLVTIARTMAVSSARKTWRETPLTDDLAENLQAQPHLPEDQEMQRMLCQMLTEMEPSSHEVLMMHYYAGKSLRECAELLDISRDAAAKRLQRAREDLGERFLAAIGEERKAAETDRKSVQRVMAAIAVSSVPWSLQSAAGYAATAGGTTMLLNILVANKFVVTGALGIAAMLGVWSIVQRVPDSAETTQTMETRSAATRPGSAADENARTALAKLVGPQLPATNAIPEPHVASDPSMTIAAATETASNPGELTDETLRKWVAIDADECRESRDRVGQADVYLIAQEKDRLALWKEGAERALPQGQVLMALCCLYGVGVDRDAAKSVEILKLAIEQGDATAKYFYATALLVGLGVERDPAAAIEMYRDAAGAGDRAAMWQLGILFGNGTEVPKDAGQSLGWLKRSAEAGAPYAMYALGQVLFLGDLGQQDEKEGRAWIARAADLGCPFGIDAMRQLSGNAPYMNLARLFTTSEDAPPNVSFPVADVVELTPDFDEAKVAGMSDETLRIEVRKDETAMRTMRDRVGYSKPYIQLNAAKRILLWDEAARRGIQEGQLLLGMCHTTKIGVEPDDTIKIELFRAAADQGDPIAMHAYGVEVQMGRVEGGEEAAFDWWKKSAEAGDSAGMHRLANCYATGYGVERNAEEAMTWYLRAATEGNAEAKYQLGQAFLSGNSFTPRDETEGRRWLAKAANGGFPKAVLALRRIVPLPAGFQDSTNSGAGRNQP